MSETRKYIYGIINSNTDFCLCVPKDLYPEGEGSKDNGVCTISYEDISAVISDSQSADFTASPKDQLVRHLLLHQHVIERIMKNVAVIPMRLGTFANNEDEVRLILAKAYPVVKDIFNKTYDKIEIDVVATWSDFNSILKKVGEEEDIRKFKENIWADSKEKTLDNQIKIGIMVKNHLDKRSEKYASEIQTSLSKISQGVKIHELMNDNMVLNTAFLVNKTKQEEFDGKIEELNAKFDDELNFRSVGPLPPYSFYTLEIKKWQFEEIEWAKKKLRLSNNLATKDEIKKAHRTMAFTFHPDINPVTPVMEREFDDITKAYKMLNEYCQKDSCYFDKEAFKKNAILVNVRE